MSPEYFIIPIIMGQASSIIESLKTGIILFDFTILAFFIFMFYNSDIDYLRDMYLRWREHNKKSIIISNEAHARTNKFKAIMYYLTKKNDTVYRLKEDAGFDWDNENETRSAYLVEQHKEFKLTDEIQGVIKSGKKEKHRSPQHSEFIDVNTLVVYSYSLSLEALQKWVDEKVKEYKDHLRHTSIEKQLFITARNGKNNENTNKKKKGNNSISIESVPWESAITFQNSYFQEMETVMKKIDFFLNNKEWYMKKGIPYNLGILLYGEPGCGKTRFIKQLMNYTNRHGIDIKLNDGMDFIDLQHIIYNEELDDTHIIPQDQRIIIFEDIDALGEVVKERKPTTQTKSTKPVKATRLDDCSSTSNDNNNDNDDDSTSNDDDSTSTSNDSGCHLPIHTLTKPKNSAGSEVSVLSSFLKMTNETENKNKNNNLSCLLNMLDGINECCGRIIIMTTNRVEVLDKALIRPGRIDIKLHFKKCSSYDVAKMIEKFWDICVPLEDILEEINNKYTSADIINIFRSTDDFECVRKEFLKV